MTNLRQGGIIVPSASKYEPNLRVKAVVVQWFAQFLPMPGPIQGSVQVGASAGAVVCLADDLIYEGAPPIKRKYAVVQLEQLEPQLIRGAFSPGDANHVTVPRSVFE